MDNRGRDNMDNSVSFPSLSQPSSDRSSLAYRMAEAWERVLEAAQC
jgi:hypothetical protein